MNNFVKDRHKAFISAVMEDNWDGIKRYSKKYGVPMPKNEAIMKAGVYKAVQYCTDISEEIKVVAMQKCIKLGFNPFIAPMEVKDADSD